MKDDKWRRRKWEIDFYLNPRAWLWQTSRFDHCTIRHRGPFTITTYKGWASHYLYTKDSNHG